MRRRGRAVVLFKEMAGVTQEVYNQDASFYFTKDGHMANACVGVQLAPNFSNEEGW